MRDVLLALAVALIVVVAVARPWIGVLGWTWIGLMNPHRLTWGFMYSSPTAALVGGATLVGLLLTKERRKPPLTGVTVFLTLLVLHFNFTTLLAWNPEAAWVQWDKVMKILLFTYVTMILIYGREKIRWLLIITAGSIGFYGAKGGVFSLINGGQYKIWGPEGTFIDGNNEIGLAMIMVWPLAMLLARDPVKWVRWPAQATVWLMPLSIVFTYSRGALLGMAAVCLPLWLRAKRKVRLALLMIPVAAFAVWFAPQELVDRAETIKTYEQDNSSMQRIQAWGVAWNVARAYPITGAGFNLDFTDDARWLSYANFLGEWNNRARAAHSIYFQILGDHGFVGLFLFLGCLLGSMVALGRLRREARELPDCEWLADTAMALQLGLVGYAVAGAFLSLAYFDLFYIYVAATAILQRELRDLRELAARPALAASAAPGRLTAAPRRAERSER